MTSYPWAATASDQHWYMLFTPLQDMFCAIGVCKSWRAAGHAMFFKDSWGSGMQTPSGPAIQHPAQLITLCPLQHSPGGHVKCYMQRELVSNGLSGKVHRYVLRQGVDYAKANGKFLLAAVQEGKQSHSIFLDRSCSGKPIARISANVMRTTYTLLTAAGSGGSRNARTGRSSSTGDEKQQAAHGAEQQHVHDISSSSSSSSSSSPSGAGVLCATAVQLGEQLWQLLLLRSWPELHTS
ncbi:hypothetical protein COO60DRAFT_683495 [Scenedesmus sp. NREL 46B-D3]|nr:hypothetical protein COO60DRAFT_683495 [Scenedesmus sp. NREL 46B-D3]